jgi:hypothetical protein
MTCGSFSAPPGEDRWYELLKDGQAIPWGKSPAGYGFDYWEIESSGLVSVDVRREKK